MVLDAQADKEKIAAEVDFIFCAVDMKKEDIRALEEAYAKLECPVVSNNSAHRWTPDVPMVIPEVNPEHLAVLEAQKARLGTRRGFIAVKSNCSIQSYAPALHPLRPFGLERVLVCTYQAISGAGKTFATWPEMVDNVIPYIGGEEEKSEQEPLKVWGTVENGEIVKAPSPSITAQCLRVPVSDGHTAAVFVSFRNKPSLEEIKACWSAFRGRPQELDLPSAPKQFLHYSRSPTGPRPSWTGTWRGAWPSPWGGCGRTPSTTISSSGSPTTPSGGRPAAASCWLSCCARRATSSPAEVSR